MKKMNSTIKQVTYWYNAMTSNVEWIVEYKTGYRRMYAINTLPKKVNCWLQSDKATLVQIGDTGEGAWHVERWEEK